MSRDNLGRQMRYWNGSCWKDAEVTTVPDAVVLEPVAIPVQIIDAPDVVLTDPPAIVEVPVIIETPVILQTPVIIESPKIIEVPAADASGASTGEPTT